MPKKTKDTSIPYTRNGLNLPAVNPPDAPSDWLVIEAIKWVALVLLLIVGGRVIRAWWRDRDY